jgi:hypothetical protein
MINLVASFTLGIRNERRWATEDKALRSNPDEVDAQIQAGVTESGASPEQSRSMNLLHSPHCDRPQISAIVDLYRDFGFNVLNGAKRLRINPLMVSPSNHWNDWNRVRY